MTTRRLLGTVLFTTILCLPTFSQVTWYANPDKPYLESFYALNLQPNEDGTVTTMMDDEHGKIWVVNKPIGSKRAELARSEPKNQSLARYAPKEGDLKYIGWKTKISIVGDVQPPDFEIFQLKSYTGGNQNYPIDIEYNKGTLVLEAFDPGTTCQSCRGRDLCEYDLGENNWAYIVLGIKFSNDADVGYVECWINGEKQDLLRDDANKRAKHRTLDDTGNYFKWGAYKALVYDYDITNYLDEMRIADTYEEANPYTYEMLTSISDISSYDDGLSVYPNPTSSSFTIDFAKAERATVYIYNLLGELVYCQQSVKQTLTIDTQGIFKPGLYCIKVVDKDGLTYSEKITVSQ